MTINITVKNKIAALTAPACIVCGNSDYLIRFKFDEEWTEYDTKTARFVADGQYTDTVFTGDTVSVPVITDARAVAVGVYAGDLHTTTPAVIGCMRSITSADGAPADPPESVYNQLLMELDKRMKNPAAEGSAGQVLATDGNGGRYWTNQTGGGASEVEIDNKTIVKDADGNLCTTVGGYEEATSNAVLYENDALFLKDSGGTIIEGTLSLMVGQEYTVTYNGTDFMWVAQEAPGDDAGIVYLGNLEEPSESFPITILSLPVDYWGVMCIPSVVGTTISLKITGAGTVIHKIDKKYLPDDKPPYYIAVTGLKVEDDGTYDNIQIVSTHDWDDIKPAYIEHRLFITGEMDTPDSLNTSPVLFADYDRDHAVLLIVFVVGAIGWDFCELQMLEFSCEKKTVSRYSGIGIGQGTIGPAGDFHRSANYPVSGKTIYSELTTSKFVLNSTTSGSTKKFEITVDDSGTISATEVTT